MGGIGHPLRPTHGPAGRPRPQTQARVGHEDRQLRPEHLQPGQRAQGRQDGGKVRGKDESAFWFNKLNKRKYTRQEQPSGLLL